MFRRWLTPPVLQAGAACAAAALVAASSMGSQEAGWQRGWIAAATALVAATGYAVLIFAVNRPLQRVRDDSLRRLEQHGRRLAIYDRETGLYAHWYFTLRLEEEVARARRLGDGFALLLVESLHAPLQDETERLLIERLKNAFRGTDLVAHIGNLRFVILLAGTDSVGANVVHQRLVRESMPCPVQIGLALFPDDGTDWRSLVEAAEAKAEPAAAAAA